MNKLVSYRNVTQNISVAINFFIFSILIEILSSLIILQAFPTMLITGVCILSLISLIIFVLPRKYIRASVAIFLVTLQCVMAVVNEVLYRTTNELFTISKIALAGNVTGGVVSMSMIRWEIILLYLGIIGIFVLSTVCTHRHYKIYRPTRKVFTSIIVLSIFTSSFLTCFASVPLACDDNLLNMLTTQCPVNTSYKNYGYYTFYASHITNSIFSTIRHETLDEDMYLDYLSDSTNTANEYTGISRDNNVILILCESLESFGIDSYFTPNLYNLMYNNSNSMYMSGYHSTNKTNMSEGTAFLGTYSSSNQLAATGSADLSYALSHISLPNKLKQIDPSIVTSYYHGLTSSFYHRDTTFDKLGIDHMYFGQTQESDIKHYNHDKGISYTWTTNDFYSFIKDSNFIEYNIDTFIPDTGRFYTQYATISTHGTYEPRGANKEFYDILTSTENKVHFNKMISDLEDSGYKPHKMMTQFTYYKSAMMDLDKTIGIIMNRLADTNHLDDTTMVLYSDHNAYYDSMSWVLKSLNGSYDASVYNLPCIIYDSKMTAKYRELESIVDTDISIQNDMFMSVMDIYPTLCNVLGLEYNTTLAYGQSIFDDTPRVFMTFADTGYVFNKDFFYDGSTTHRQGSSHDTTEFTTMLNDMLYKYHMQENLYKHEDSFRSIMNKLYNA